MSRLGLVVLMVLVAEIGAALLLPMLVSDERYLDWYLTDQQISAERRFLRSNHVLLPDSVTGWRSAPNWREGTWVTDSLGSRSTGRFEWSRSDRPRVIGLGSSMMNGDMGVTNAETITAYLEDAGATSLNFGTMLFGVDQALLQFRHRLIDLGPDWVVVGIDSGAEAALTNTYVPFLRRSEANMPFVKPRFVLAGDTLVEIPAAPNRLLGSDRRQALIDHTAIYDGYAGRFERFRRMGQTPGLAALAWVGEKVNNRILGSGYRDPSPGLLVALLEALDTEVDAAGGRLLVLLLPPRPGESGPPPWMADPFERRRSDVSRAGLRVVDGRSIVEAVRSAGDDAYGPDGVHFSPEANRALAAALWNVIGRD